MATPDGDLARRPRRATRHCDPSPLVQPLPYPKHLPHLQHLCSPPPTTLIAAENSDPKCRSMPCHRCEASQKLNGKKMIVRFRIIRRRTTLHRFLLHLKIFSAKAGTGSATLSMAYAAAKFADACLRGLKGEAGIVECSFVASQVTELPFFASKVRLGRGGAEEIFPLGPLNEYERAGLEMAKNELSESIHKGISFIRK